MADEIKIDRSVVGELVMLLGAAQGVFAQLKSEQPPGLARVVFEGYEDSAKDLGEILTNKFNEKET